MKLRGFIEELKAFCLAMLIMVTVVGVLVKLTCKYILYRWKHD